MVAGRGWELKDQGREGCAGPDSRRWAEAAGMVRSGLGSNSPDSAPTISGFKSQLHDVELQP